MREPVYTELTAAQRAERTRGLIVGVEEKLHDCDNNIAINLAIAAARQDRAEGRQVMNEVEKLRRDRTGFLTALPVLRARHARELELVEPPPSEEDVASEDAGVEEGASSDA